MIKRLAFVGSVFLIALSAAAAQPAQTQLPFGVGEKLTYEISWSNILQAGTAVMEVREAQSTDGKKAYHLVSTAKSAGLVSRFYRVSDTVESVLDTTRLRSLSFHLDQQHGKRKKKRDMLFDQDKGIAHVFSNGKEENYTIPEDVQDALSALYYVRTRQEFTVGKPIVFNVHEDGKTWAVEVHILGREKIKIDLGQFNTIKLKTYPRYEGVFQNKGEIYIWLTDDERRIPVLMKSTISIGSIVSTLVELRNGEENKDDKH
jgi:hypothetical protein